jgi:hypothetical protein
MRRLRACAGLAKGILLIGEAQDRMEAKNLSEAKVINMVLKQELGIGAR